MKLEHHKCTYCLGLWLTHQRCLTCEVLIHPAPPPSQRKRYRCSCGEYHVVGEGNYCLNCLKVLKA